MLPFYEGNPRCVAILDNVALHCTTAAKEPFRQAGVLVIYLPPYSLDLNTIELAFSKVKY